MHMHPNDAKAHKARCAWVMIAGLGLGAAAAPALAQTAPAAPAASADAAPSEALRRQALSPYRFILQNASAPARAKPAAAPASEAKRPTAPPPIEQAAVRPSLATTPVPAAAPVPEPAAQPVPAPVAALAPRPAEPTPVAEVRKALIAVKQDPPELTGPLAREQPTGTVKVGFEVNRDGSTSGVKVLSSTNRRLNSASIAAVTGWKFQPIDEVRPTEVELVFSSQ